MYCLSWAAIPTIAPIAAVRPSRAVAPGALLGGYTGGWIRRGRSAIGSRRAIHSVGAIESVGAVGAREIGGIRHVVAHWDIEIRHEVAMRDRNDVKVSGFALAHPWIG